MEEAERETSLLPNEVSMKPKVYIETTVISYLTAPPSNNLLVVAHQNITRDWWDKRRRDFELFASILVQQEASAGNEKKARERLKALRKMKLLEVTTEALALANDLIERGPLPEKAAEDALHIAIAVTNGLDYLISWNCKHIANAAMRTKIEEICYEKSYVPAIICTPEELLEV